MKRKLVVTMMLCLALTGCQSGLSSIDEKTEGTVVINDGEPEVDVATEVKTENSDGVYDELISDLKAAVEKGDVT